MTMCEEEELRKAKVYAWKRLARKGQPSAELRKHLEDKGFTRAIIENVIEVCQSQGYLDDQAWIEGFVKRETQRGQSAKAIAYKLMRKGLSGEIAESAIGDFCGQDAQIETLKGLIAKKQRGVDLTDRGQRDKLIASFCRKGFALGEILRAMREIGETEEE